MATWIPSDSSRSNAEREITNLRATVSKLSLFAGSLEDDLDDVSLEAIERFDAHLTIARQQSRSIRRLIRHFNKCREDAFNGKVHQ